MAIKNEFLDEIGDTIFTIAMAAAIGLAVANLAIQITASAVLDAASVGHENVSTTISEAIRHDIGPVG
jgi:hypothetical protein